jgi:tRNA pseudouridine38-40 synthase
MELQYDGTGLHGWAKQPGVVTVEGCLEKAFATALGAVPSLRVAGRTDAGVHARCQVVSLQLPRAADLAKLSASLNALTPVGIVITRMVRTSADFDARKSAIGRGYRYFLRTNKAPSPFWARYCWQLGHPLDQSLLDAAAEATLGLHDFTAFTPAETEHIFFRRIVSRCRWRRVPGEPGMLCLEIEADAFLRHMVRTLVGTMVEVAEGRRGLESFQSLLKHGGREAAGLTAPAQGLFLWSIRYGGGRAREGEASC